MLEADKVIREYLYYLKRYEDAIIYFDSLNDDDFGKVPEKVWNEYEKIVKKTAELNLKAQKYGCYRIRYYREGK